MMRLLGSRKGVAAVETALVLTFLMTPLLSILVGAGQGMLLQYRVDRALHSGLMYAWWATGTNATVAAVKQAAQDGYGTAPPTMTAAASYACYCIDSAGTRATGISKPCNASCGTGTLMAQYVTVTTTDTYTPIFTMNWGTSAWTVSATGTVRVPPP